MNPKVSKTDRAYAAGIIDGEGSIWICSYKSMNLSIEVHMTTSTIPVWLHGTFGGQLTIGQDRYGKTYRWNIRRASQCLWFLKQISSFLKLKRPQAELAFQFLATIGPQGRKGMKKLVALGIVEQRKSLAEALSILNRRRPAPLTNEEQAIPVQLLGDRSNHINQKEIN